MIHTTDVVEAFYDTALLLELADASSFKVRAYENAARNLASLKQPLEQIVSTLNSGGIKGIGQQMSSYIKELYATGNFEELNKLKQQFPETILELRTIRGLGAKKIKLLYTEHSITSISALEEACKNSTLLKSKGFGKKTIENILESIDEQKRYRGKQNLGGASRTANQLLTFLKEQLGGTKETIRIVGQVNRGFEIIDTIELLIQGEDSERIVTCLSDSSLVQQETISSETNNLVQANLPEGPKLLLHLSSAEEFAWNCIRHTSSDAHVEALLQEAKELKIIEDEETKILASSEKAIYFQTESAVVPPEMRETAYALERGKHAYEEEHESIPLVSNADVKGILHAHSTYSDGNLSLRDLAITVAEQGYEYLGISDHSQTAVYAGGLKEADIKRQHKEINRLNADLAPFKIFKGIESDILTDGSLDYPREILAQFDFVIASLHSQLRMEMQVMTQRVLNAVSNPFTTILGHITARRLLRREASPMDIDAILKRCGEMGVVVEINANPQRLDLPWQYHQTALEQNVLLSINPDAHTAAGLGDIQYGVTVARKGALLAENILSCMNLEQISQYFKERKETALKSH